MWGGIQSPSSEVGWGKKKKDKREKCSNSPFAANRLLLLLPPPARECVLVLWKMMSCVYVCVCLRDRGRPVCPSPLSAAAEASCGPHGSAALLLTSPPPPPPLSKTSSRKDRLRLREDGTLVAGKKKTNNKQIEALFLDPLCAEEGVVESHAHFFCCCIRLKLIRQSIFSHICPLFNVCFSCNNHQKHHILTLTKMNTRPVSFAQLLDSQMPYFRLHLNTQSP